MKCKNCGKTIRLGPTSEGMQWVHAVHTWIGCRNERTNSAGEIGVRAEPSKEYNIRKLLCAVDTAGDS